MLTHEILKINIDDIVFANTGKTRQHDVIMKGILKRIPTILDDMYELLTFERFEAGFSKRYLNLCYSKEMYNNTVIQETIMSAKDYFGKESIKVELYYMMDKAITRYLRFRVPKSKPLAFFVFHLFYNFRDYIRVYHRFMHRINNEEPLNIDVPAEVLCDQDTHGTIDLLLNGQSSRVMNYIAYLRPMYSNKEIRERLSESMYMFKKREDTNERKST